MLIDMKNSAGCLPIVVVGAGWSGLHIALRLKREGHPVIVLERNSQILGGTSGSFGIRLHRGPHYPRSTRTRERCRFTFDRFREAYPELVVDHRVAIYANGALDATGQPSKVTDDQFAKVCMETAGCSKLDTEHTNLANVGVAFTLPEPSIVLGARLREYFSAAIQDAGLQVFLDTTVIRCTNTTNGVDVHCLSGDKYMALTSAKVVNATGFESLLPGHSAGLGIETVYQVCLALKYRKKSPDTAPMSFIVMDGWFPCLMPNISKSRSASQEAELFQDYVLTHGSHTILGSFASPADAHAALLRLEDSVVERTIRDPAVREMDRFWPTFSTEFEYQGWYGSVMAKLKTRREFRSSIVVEQSNVIHVFPGKVSNVFDAADETLDLINSGTSSSKPIVSRQGWKWLKDGVFARSQKEVTEQPDATERCTCNL